jgi:hypothetical protein
LSSGGFGPRIDTCDVLNPAFRSLTANDFDVIQLGYAPPPPAAPTGLRILSSW